MRSETLDTDIDLSETLLAAGRPADQVVGALVYRGLDEERAATIVNTMRSGGAVVRATAVPPDEKYYGVAGWLRWFCIGKVFLAPVWLAIHIPPAAAGLARLSELYPAAKRTLWVAMLLSILLTLSGIYVGVRLWAVAPGALRQVRILILAWIGAALLTLLPFQAFDLPSYLQGWRTESEAELCRAIIVGLAWLLYFQFSKRVRITYQE
jgi:hypothetical protein